MNVSKRVVFFWPRPTCNHTARLIHRSSKEHQGTCREAPSSVSIPTLSKYLRSRMLSGAWTLPTSASSALSGDENLKRRMRCHSPRAKAHVLSLDGLILVAIKNGTPKSNCLKCQRNESSSSELWPECSCGMQRQLLRWQGIQRLCALCALCIAH